MKLNRPCKIVLAALLAAQTFAADAQTTNAVAPADYPKFIAQRNIFDPNRVPNVPWTPRPRQAYTPPVVRQVDSFTLVGIIGYGEGRMAGVYAFFDGTSPDYRKTAQMNDTIANFKITDIEADSITLMSDTNETTVLRIGDQLHNDGVGHWLSANGTAARYNNNGRYGSGRNGRYGNRRRNYGNGSNGNYGSGNYNNGNYNRRGNYNNAASPASGGSQMDGQNLQNDGTAPDNTASPDNSPPDNMPPPPDDNAPPSANQQNN